MSGHTKGPWAVHEDQWVGIEVRSANAEDLAEAPGYYVLASSIGGHRYGHEFKDDSEVRANAALIAAAPDLLEACENFRAVLRSQIRDGKYREEYADAFYQAEKKMDAAIAKARTES